jgi:hypothetical protein
MIELATNTNTAASKMGSHKAARGTMRTSCIRNRNKGQAEAIPRWESGQEEQMEQGDGSLGQI